MILYCVYCRDPETPITADYIYHGMSICGVCLKEIETIQIASIVADISDIKVEAP